MSSEKQHYRSLCANVIDPTPKYPKRKSSRNRTTKGALLFLGPRRRRRRRCDKKQRFNDAPQSFVLVAAASSHRLTPAPAPLAFPSTYVPLPACPAPPTPKPHRREVEPNSIHTFDPPLKAAVVIALLRSFDRLDYKEKSRSVSLSPLHFVAFRFIGRHQTVADADCSLLRCRRPLGIYMPPLRPCGLTGFYLLPIGREIPESPGSFPDAVPFWIGDFLKFQSKPIKISNYSGSIGGYGVLKLISIDAAAPQKIIPLSHLLISFENWPAARVFSRAGSTVITVELLYSAISAVPAVTAGHGFCRQMLSAFAYSFGLILKLPPWAYRLARDCGA
ncbi:hypothetical protein EVAR_26391_1 [Eumeta japonica]|uniref:Uncharacterized protein n=1 Tax=Eumeta variegata TaxID=151549 RepID=A0A4C1VNQ3_EUMVA|nr:hypothetical protein EVAR_26391_1 [Eumeta japonica]